MERRRNLPTPHPPRKAPNLLNLQAKRCVRAAPLRWKLPCNSTVGSGVCRPEFRSRICATKITRTSFRETKADMHYLATLQLPVQEPPEPGATILVIEDARFVREVTCEILRDAGYRVLQAECATTARKIFRRHKGRIQLLLCDAVLPDSNGAQLARMLRRRAAGLKVVLVSGYPPATLRKYLDQEIEHEFLAKPYCAAALISKVEMALQNESSPETAT
jgi:CheY-like chemotaxis protein